MRRTSYVDGIKEKSEAKSSGVGCSSLTQVVTRVAVAKVAFR